MIKLNKRQLGFSILEIIVVIFIIAVGLIGVLSLMVQNIQVQYINKNNLVASQLAQEGLELIRNIRDSNWLAGRNWNNSISSGNHIVDYTGSIGSVTGISEAKLQIRDDVGGEGFFWHNATDPDSIFSRLITIEDIPPSSIRVSCLVEWEERNNTYNYTAETILYNWR